MNDSRVHLKQAHVWNSHMSKPQKIVVFATKLDYYLKMLSQSAKLTHRVSQLKGIKDANYSYNSWSKQQRVLVEEFCVCTFKT